MQIKNIKPGNTYRHRTSPDYCWAKVLQIVKPGEGENKSTKTLVKCVWSQVRDDKFGLIKYFHPRDLLEPEEIVCRKQ